MLEEFNNYVKNYDLDNPKIKLKYEHSIRVMELCREYSMKLGFSEEEIELATLIGLLHDFGRFEQLRIYNSFKDSETIDHADYSAEILFEKGFINNFWNKKEDYSLIKFAIKNHNKYKIKEIDDFKIMKFAKFIRDMDKIDILRNTIEYDVSKINLLEEEVSLNVRTSFYNHSTINYTDIKTSTDRLVCVLGYGFDIYNIECFPLVIERYKNIMEVYNNKIVNEYYDYLFKYLERGV